MGHVEENMVEAAVAALVRAGASPELLELCAENGLRKATGEVGRGLVHVDIDWRG